MKGRLSLFHATVGRPPGWLAIPVDGRARGGRERSPVADGPAMVWRHRAAAAAAATAVSSARTSGRADRDR